MIMNTCGRTWDSEFDGAKIRANLPQEVAGRDYKIVSQDGTPLMGRIGLGNSLTFTHLDWNIE